MRQPVRRVEMIAIWIQGMVGFIEESRRLAPDLELVFSAKRQARWATCPWLTSGPSSLFIREDLPQASVS